MRPHLIKVLLLLVLFLFHPSTSTASPDFHGSCGQGIDTAIGCVPYEIKPFITTLLRWGISLSGGVLIIMISIGAFFITTAGGDPKKVKAGQELITSSIGGIILIVFSVLILNFLGVQILQLDGLGFQIN